ncbi:Insulinase (Peptidase family M16) family protein [Cryptosporidium meleagridis]|uniref:Insulinase (Peptidase family M16) family protein n=1 Tax=Cryptosporidium meleagridis TaxID=93969 RepID=A0A2P4Z6D8_9CRYT|nr:Insulinase (Peptidase family M16) family protein [Cryptosporidium meleagridis]
MTEIKTNLKEVQNEITKPIYDENEYRALVLKNNLRVLLVRDENTDISGASMSVFVGSQQDPEELNGLAHFLEHMLFLGSARHPNPNDFDDYMKLNGGSSNAFTDHLSTSYFFEIKNESFEHALDLFSAFFICPLFDTKYVDREVNAVNSEHNKNLLSDLWIRYHLISSIARKGHPLRKFGTGSLETLKYEPEKKGIDLIAELKNFHNKYYSSNNMFLTLVSNCDLDELESYAVRYFSEIVDKNVGRIDYFSEFQKERPYLSIMESPEDGALESIVYVIPNKDEKKVCFNFQVPDLRKFRKGLPEMYFTNILGHEGPGSLTSALRRNGWCLALSSGLNEMYSANLFEITITLTEKGAREVLSVIEYTLNFVNLVIKNEIDMEVVSDLEKLSQLVFDYRNRPSLDETISNNAFALANLPPLKELLTFGNRVEKMDVDAVKYLKQYFDPKNMFILLSIPENKALIENERLKDKLIYDRHYNINYLKLEFGPEIKEIISNISLSNASKFGLKIPTKNNYIPENFDLMNTYGGSMQAFPTVLEIPGNSFSDRVVAYYKPDTNFRTPHGFSQFFFFSSNKVTCELLVLDTLASLTLSKIVAEEAYNATIANLDYKISGGYNLRNSMNCLSITVSGFNDKMQALLKFLIKSLVELKNDGKKQLYKSFFEDSLEESRLSVRNSLFNPDILAHLTSYNFREFYSAYTPSKEEILSILSTTTYVRLCDHISTFLSQCLIRSITVGNLNKEQARELVETVTIKELLSSEELNSKMEKTIIRNCIDLKKAIESDPEVKTNRIILSKSVMNPMDKNGSVIYSIDMGEYNLRNYVLLELLSKYLDSNCYLELRTNQQLGYIVHACSYNLKPAIGIYVCVQSSDFSNSHVINRIHNLLDDLLVVKLSEKLDEDQFNILVDSEIKIYSNKPKNIKEEVAQYLTTITNGESDFDWKDKSIKILESLTYQEFCSFIADLISRPRTIIQSVSALDASKKCEDVANDFVPNGFTVIKDFKHFRNTSELLNITI